MKGRIPQGGSSSAVYMLNPQLELYLSNLQDELSDDSCECLKTRRKAVLDNNFVRRLPTMILSPIASVFALTAAFLAGMYANNTLLSVTWLFFSKEALVAMMIVTACSYRLCCWSHKLWEQRNVALASKHLVRLLEYKQRFSSCLGSVGAPLPVFEDTSVGLDEGYLDQVGAFLDHTVAFVHSVDDCIDLLKATTSMWLGLGSNSSSVVRVEQNAVETGPRRRLRIPFSRLRQMLASTMLRQCCLLADLCDEGHSIELDGKVVTLAWLQATRQEVVSLLSRLVGEILVVSRPNYRETGSLQCATDSAKTLTSYLQAAMTLEKEVSYANVNWLGDLSNLQTETANLSVALLSIVDDARSLSRQDDALGDVRAQYWSPVLLPLLAAVRNSLAKIEVELLSAEVEGKEPSDEFEEQVSHAVNCCGPQQSKLEFAASGAVVGEHSLFDADRGLEQDDRVLVYVGRSPPLTIRGIRKRSGDRKFGSGREALAARTVLADELAQRLRLLPPKEEVDVTEAFPSLRQCGGPGDCNADDSEHVPATVGFRILSLDILDELASTVAPQEEQGREA